MTILDKLADHARIRVEADKKRVSPEQIRELALAAAGYSVSDAGRTLSGRSFYSEISKPGLSFICEVKKASPSKGVIDPIFDYMKTAGEYENAGADCISCLTEPKWFMGSDEIFRNIREIVNVPMIRKDFTIDEYQIYQAKTMGADCVLLICALLNTDTIAKYLEICRSLKLDALVETHDESEIRSAIAAGAKIIGVNNRNLKDFSVDFENAAKLRDLIPADCVYVAESGVSRPEDTALLRSIGADAVLVGEMLMRADDKKSLLARMRRAAERGGA